MEKQFTKKEVEKKVKKVLKKFEAQELSGERFSLRRLIGDYQFNSRNRHIKEVLFRNRDTSGRPYGTWVLAYPDMKKKQMVRTVMSSNAAVSEASYERSCGRR